MFSYDNVETFGLSKLCIYRENGLKFFANFAVIVNQNQTILPHTIFWFTVNGFDVLNFKISV